MTKRIGALVTVLALFFTLFMIPETARAGYTAYSCCSNGKPLNLRTGPGKEYPVIFEVNYGGALEVDYDLGNGWSRIYRNGTYAYAMTALMSRTYPGRYQPDWTPDPSPASYADGSELNNIFKRAKFVTPYRVTLRGTRGSGSVNVRWAPSLNSSLIYSYAYGSTMQVIAELGDWYQVVDPVTGITGFVMRTFAYR